MVLSLGTLCREIGSSPPELIGTVNGFVPLQLTSSSFAVLTSKRFRKVYQDWNHVKYINMWAGTKWLLRAGRRYKITTVLGN